MRPIVTIKAVQLEAFHICYLCGEDLPPGEAIRLSWAAAPVGGLGYFHEKPCSESMIKALSKTHKTVYAEKDKPGCSNQGI